MREPTGSTAGVTLADLVARLERLPAWAWPHVAALLELLVDFATAAPDDDTETDV